MDGHPEALIDLDAIQANVAALRGRVIEEVNRYWRGRIILLNGDLGRRRVSVRLELARIEEIISYVQSVLGASVRRLPGGVVLLT